MQRVREGTTTMMGRGAGGQKQLFYSFNLDAHVPADHLLRGIDRCLELRELRRQLAPFYSHTGRPSIDPELMVRMLLIGYSFGLRSERRLCEEVHLNLGYRWFCRLGLEDAVPDHSTFSKNRHGRFRESDAFRLVFESVVERCMKAGLVGGEGFAVDASLVEADANRSRSMAREEVADLRDPCHATRAVREYLAALDAQGEPGTPAASISPTDPAARWTASGGPAFYAYSTNYLVDVRAGIIVDVEATPAWRIAEVNATRIMIDLPLSLGMVWGHFFTTQAEWAEPKLRKLGGVLLAVLLILALIDIWEVVLGAGQRVTLAIVVVTAVALAVGHLIGGPEPATRTATAISSAARNPGLALLVVTLNGAPSAITATVLAYFVIAALTLIPYIAWRRRAGTTAGAISDRSSSN